MVEVGRLCATAFAQSRFQCKHVRIRVSDDSSAKVHARIDG